MYGPYVVCRSSGHAMRVDHDLELPEWDWPHVVGFRCPDCTTERYDGYDENGDVRQRFYRYPSDYRFPANETPERREFRLALILEVGQ